MTNHLCIPLDIDPPWCGPVRGLSARALRKYSQAERSAAENGPGPEQSVTILMQRAAPSNFAFKWPAGRSPLPALKRLLSP
jgi:hypothetical protein